MINVLNIFNHYFTRIESGKQRPNDKNLYKIANILGVEIKDLFDFEHQKSDNDLISEIVDKLKIIPKKYKIFIK